MNVINLNEIFELATDLQESTELNEIDAIKLATKLVIADAEIYAFRQANCLDVYPSNMSALEKQAVELEGIKDALSSIRGEMISVEEIDVKKMHFQVLKKL